MSGATPKGYPYPTGSDSMTLGDNVLNQLATSIDTRLGAVAAGTLLFNKFGTTNPDTIAVTYPAGRFVAGVAVMPSVTFKSTTPMAARVTVTSATPTGVTVQCFREQGTTDTTVYWAASQLAG